VVLGMKMKSEGDQGAADPVNLTASRTLLVNWPDQFNGYVPGERRVRR
jgi:hypothetical protein